MITLEQESAKRSYREEGYALLERLFSPVVLAVFHGKLQQDLQPGSSNNFVSTNPLLTKEAIEVYSRRYPPMASFHWGLTAKASEIAGCELIPTYAYFRVYQQGDVCRVHSDREACEHSMSLTVELADDRPWALAVEKRRIEAQEPVAATFADGEVASLPMRAGDAVMYRGVNHRHGRVQPNPNRWSAHLFMFWVDSKGPFADHAFDRVALGKLGVSP